MKDPKMIFGVPTDLHVVSSGHDTETAQLKALLLRTSKLLIAQGYRESGEAVASALEIIENLSVNEARYRSLLDTQRQVIARSDITGRLTFVNDAYCRAFGKSAEEFLGNLFLPTVLPEDVPISLAALNAIQKPPYRIQTETRHSTAEGIRWYSWDNSAVLDEAGMVVEFQGVGLDITARKEAEEALRNFSGRLMTAQEQERAWIARELHDGIGQHLAILAIGLDRLKKHPPEHVEVSAQMELLSTSAKQMSEDLRRLSHGLHPSMLEHLGLAAVLKGICREMERSGNIAIQFMTRDVPRTLPQNTALCLYRIAQEALQNVVKHSDAKQVTVEVVVEGDQIHMRITDDGKGFDIQAIPVADSIGLIGMRERIGLVKGKLQLNTHPGQGTVVDVLVPLQASLKSPR